MRTNEIKNKIDEIKKWEDGAIRFFGDNIYTGKTDIDEAEVDQSNLIKNWEEFRENSKPRTKTSKDKRNTFESVNALYEGRELILNAFKSGIFSIKATKGKGQKILTPKQMLQRVPIALGQVKVDSTSENLLNKIRQIIYSLYRAKEITKKVYSNIVNSIKL